MHRSIRVRRATHRDALALAHLRHDQRAHRGIPAEETAAFVERCEPWMAARLRADAAWRCWVAERHGSLVGTIWLQVIEKIPNPVHEPERHGYITSFFVRESERNAGVGTALLAALLEEAAADGLDALFLWPTERSRPLYARHGFTVREDLLERRPAHAQPVT